MCAAGRVNPLVEAVREGVEALRSGRRLRKSRVRVKEPPRYGAKDIARIRRKKLKTSQRAFASYIGVSTSTVRAWEQGQRKPSPLARRMLQVAESEPALFAQLIGA